VRPLKLLLQLLDLSGVSFRRRLLALDRFLQLLCVLGVEIGRVLNERLCRCCVSFRRHLSFRFLALDHFLQLLCVLGVEVGRVLLERLRCCCVSSCEPIELLPVRRFRTRLHFLHATAELGSVLLSERLELHTVRPSCTAGSPLLLAELSLEHIALVPEALLNGSQP
jgi:hypothetical protein